MRESKLGLKRLTWPVLNLVEICSRLGLIRICLIINAPRRKQHGDMNLPFHPGVNKVLLDHNEITKTCSALRDIVDMFQKDWLRGPATTWFGRRGILVEQKIAKAQSITNLTIAERDENSIMPCQYPLTIFEDSVTLIVFKTGVYASMRRCFASTEMPHHCNGLNFCEER